MSFTFLCYYCQRSV